MIIVTRTLDTVEFGTWGLITGLSSYAVMIHPIISYWVLRETARGIESAKTATVSSAIFSLGGISIYLILVYLIGPASDVNLGDLVFASILIPVMFLYYVVHWINLGWKPHVTSYGLISISITQLISGLFLVYFFDMGVVGVILSVFIAYLIGFITQGIFGRSKIKNKLKKEFLINWIKLSWLPIYPSIAMLISKIDIFLFTVISGSVIGLAFWTAALVITAPIGNAAMMSRGIYPKLLRKDDGNFLQQNITYVFYFLLPFTALAITFARPALFTLNPVFEFVSIVVIFLAIRVLVNTLSDIFQEFLIGLEDVDTRVNPNFKDFMQSKLFIVPTIRIIQSIIFITTLIIGFYYFISDAGYLDVLIFWAFISVAIQIPFCVYLYIMLKRNSSLIFEKKSVLKYLFSSIIVFVPIYYFSESFFTYSEKLVEFLPQFLIFIGLSLGAYIVITYFIDSTTRKLFIAIFREIKK